MPACKRAKLIALLDIIIICRQVLRTSQSNKCSSKSYPLLNAVWTTVSEPDAGLQLYMVYTAAWKTL